MENTIEPSSSEEKKETKSIAREQDIDIIKGASDTSQLDRMKENAQRDSSTQSTQVPLPAVNNGSSGSSNDS
jgi:hypothetical protein